MYVLYVLAVPMTQQQLAEPDESTTLAGSRCPRNPPINGTYRDVVDEEGSQVFRLIHDALGVNIVQLPFVVVILR